MRRTGAHASPGWRRRFPPGIERIIRRRRRWAWTALAALVFIGVCGGAGPGYLFSDSGTHGVLVALVLALWAAALCLVGVGTLQLRHRGVYTTGFLDAPFRPVRPWASRRRRPGQEWLARAVLSAGVLAFLALTLSAQVNAVAYLTDSTSTAVFLPLSYVRDCGNGGCTIRTAGIIEGSRRPTVWPAELPLGRALPVQVPVWSTGSSPTLMTSEQAVGFTLLAMIIDAAAVCMLPGYLRRLSRRLAAVRRNHQAAGPGTGSDPRPAGAVTRRER